MTTGNGHLIGELHGCRRRPGILLVAVTSAVVGLAAGWLLSWRPHRLAKPPLLEHSRHENWRHIEPAVTPFSLPPPAVGWAHQATQLDVPTLVSPLRRLLTLQLALTALLNNVPGDFVETGVYKGGTSILLLKALEAWDRSSPTADQSNNQPRRLWAADSFQGTPAPDDAHDGAAAAASGGRLRAGVLGEYAAPLSAFRAALHQFRVADLEVRLRILPGWFNETLPNAPIGAISFLRLDGDLYSSTMHALEALYSRVSPGGLVYVDDYGAYAGCKAAVDEFRGRHRISAPLQLQPVPEGFMTADMRWAAAWWMKEPGHGYHPPAS